MTLPLQGFVTPESNYGGLYKVTQDIEQRNARDARAAEQDEAKRNSMTKFLTDYADPKEHLSGSPLDPEVTHGFYNILQSGVDLIKNNKGLTTDMLLMAISPQVNKLATYASKAKALKANIDKTLTTIDPNSGYDKLNLQKEAQKQAWYNPDGTMRDLESIDPSVDPVMEAIKNNPAGVTTNKGLDEYLKGVEKNVNTTEVTKWNSRGGKEKRKVEINAPAGFIPDVDGQGVATGKFVPEYEIATDDGNPILHEFVGADGKTVNAPVRMITDPQFNRIMANSPGTADWVRGQVMNHIKEYKDVDGNPIKLDSPQAKNIAKTILYDELKGRNMGSMKEIVESKPTQVKIFAPRQPKQASASDIAQAEAENNLHKTLNDRPKDSNGYIETSDVLTGINILNVFKNAIKGAEIKYNPDKQEFSYQTQSGEKKMPYHEFATLAATANPGTDLKWLKGFKTYSRESDVADLPTEPEKKGFFGGLKNAIKTGVESMKKTEPAKPKKPKPY